MSTRRTPTLDLSSMRRMLDAAGWQTTLGDVLEGWRDDLPGEWAVHIDQGGRVRLTRHYPAVYPQTARRRRRGLTFILYGERTDTVEITTVITQEEQLTPALSQMIVWALEPPFEYRELADHA